MIWHIRMYPVTLGDVALNLNSMMSTKSAVVGKSDTAKSFGQLLVPGLHLIHSP